MSTWSYADRIPPEWYRCSRCGRSRIKLWRLAKEFATQLSCTGCLKLPASAYWTPAIPIEGTLDYFAVSTASNSAVAWWNQLPQE